MPTTFAPIDYATYAEAVASLHDVAEVRQYAVLEEPTGRFPVFRLEVPAPAGAPLLVVTSGFHGEERSGPLTLAERFRAFAAKARAARVRLVVFPCVNPSGFVSGQRYNASGERPNNDFLRYEVEPGKWKGELMTSEPFLRYELFRGSPKETRALLPELESLETPVAMLDLHQDNYAPGGLVYAYTFGEKAPYLALLERSKAYAEIGANLPVDEHRKVGADGLIEFCDGSITDYFFRRGARYIATLETTTTLPFEVTREIDALWVEGFIELAARRR